MAKTKYSGKFRSAAQLENAWEDYKNWCDTQTVKKVVSTCVNDGEVTKEVVEELAPTTYSVKEFAVFCGMTERNFYATYDKDVKFQLVIDKMKSECELDTKRKFENGTLNPKLAGLWMSRWGYGTNQNVTADVKNTNPYEGLTKEQLIKLAGDGE